eukprot:CAMPEP_0197543942 /NCGR_PEP_ID=MMETSP1318-20131121/68460_1 /TAXON_ID=552666 /ORGANISM="Partenskyella glossopodia, Strain RCC365" /LENGTH=120 /DNA_ID=CAMNT_0043103311 /DNA_START=1572 /DNA_END=1934 /DNA_ORIENTATION=+
MAPAANAAPPTGSPLSAKLLTVVQSTPVVIFQSPTCPFCKAAVSVLNEEGVEHIALTVSQEERSALKELTGSRTVPSIWVGGKFIGGYSDGPEEWMGLIRLLDEGAFHDMVDEAIEAQED